MTFRTAALAAAICASLPVPAFAQDSQIDTAPADPYADTVFSGDYISVGIGAVLSPSYSGSNDYVVSPLPIVQASFGGIDLNPRPAGLAVDFVSDSGKGPGFDLGIAGRLRADRAQQISDSVVKSLGELDRAVELGPTAGISFPAVFNPYDSVTISTDVMWDVAGAHDGMVIAPSLAYFTPLSEAVAASLTFSAQYADGDFHDYYYRVTPAQNLATGGVLPAFEPQGGGFTSAGVNLLLGFDLDGNLANGGLGLVAIVGYSRMLGDAKRTPFTSVRGSADQFLGGLGLGYTF